MQRLPLRLLIERKGTRGEEERAITPPGKEEQSIDGGSQTNWGQITIADPLKTSRSGGGPEQGKEEKKGPIPPTPSNWKAWARMSGGFDKKQQ